MSVPIWFIDNECDSGLLEMMEGHRHNQEKIFILADENTLKYCLHKLIDLIPALQDSLIIEIPPGEEHKTLETCRAIWEKLTYHEADRKSLVINLGGGVIGDIGGFSASLYKRGIRYYQCPTTLLAQVDACIGGKTGVNFKGLKNQLGLYAKPEGILIIPGFLKTLDSRQYRSGYAEMIKIALVHDQGLWQQLSLIQRPEHEITLVQIRKAIENKVDVTEEDFREKGLRKILNFGHTLGHAIESLKLSAGEMVLHGEAVAAGMVCAAFISMKNKKIDQVQCNIITYYIMSIYNKVSLNEDDIPFLTERVRQDKKNEKEKICFTLLHGIGQAETGIAVQPERIRESIQYYLSQ